MSSLKLCNPMRNNTNTSSKSSDNIERRFFIRIGKLIWKGVKKRFYRIKTKTYRVACKAYLLFFNEVGSVEKYLGFFVLCAANLLVHLYNPSHTLTGIIISVSILAGYMAITGLLYFFVARITKNFVGNTGFLNIEYLSVDEDNKVISINRSKIKDLNVRYLNVQSLQGDLRFVANLTKKTYSHTIWGTDRKTNHKRNHSHVQKNDRAIQLILDKDSKTAVGFTHVIAVNEYTWYRYEGGLIRDRELRGRFVVPPQHETVDEVPFGLVLFSVALEKDAVLYDGSGNDLLLRAISTHVDDYCEREFRNCRTIPILFQTMNIGLIRSFKKYRTNGRNYSRDGARLICFDMNNPYATLKIA